MKDNHSSGLHNVAPDLSCSNATKLSKTGVFLPGELHGQSSLAGYSPWIAKSQTHLGVYHTRASLVSQTVNNLPAIWEAQVPSLGWEESLEKGVATHSSILAWRIPWIEEPVRQ